MAGANSPEPNRHGPASAGSWSSSSTRRGARPAGSGNAPTGCREHNARLAGLADELLGAYEQKGVFSALLEKGHLTGLQRIEAERLRDEYRGRLNQERLGEESGIVSK